MLRDVENYTRIKDDPESLKDFFSYEKNNISKNVSKNNVAP